MNITLLPALSDAENQALLIEAKSDPEARERFFAHNMRLMYHVAGKFSNTGCPIEDRISATQYGFLMAFNSFDPSKGFQFSTYSAKCMENEVLMYLRKNKKYMAMLSLETSLATDEEGNKLTPLDVIKHPDNPSLAMIESDALRLALAAFKRKASERDRLIITLKYEKEWNQTAIAKRTGLSQSYVSRLETKLVDMIRKIQERQAI